jgi:hypothetical protein
MDSTKRLSVFRLYFLRAAYLLLAAGGSFISWLFRTYERLDETARAEMLEHFKSLLCLLRPSAPKTKQ